MKKLFALACSLVALESAHAMNINKGNVEVGGSVDLGLYRARSYYDDIFAVGLSASGQYFLADHLSAGLDLSFSIAGKRTGRGSIGPIVTKYLWVQERVAPYISLTPLGVSKWEGFSPEYYSSARVGTKFFLTESVAFGPALEYSYNWGSYWRDRPDRLSLLGAFSIHL